MPITAKPQTGRISGPPQSGGIMVYFGTGKYFEMGDPSTTQTQTFYGIWDICDKNSASNCDGQVSGRSNLQAQTILQESTPSNSTFSLRVTSNNTVDYSGSPPNKLGWYMDLLPPSGTQQGERVISAPLLRDGRIIFTTLIPSVSNPCDYGGTGWLMELNAVKGQRLSNSQPPWDITGDGIINSQDLVAYSSTNVSPSGKKSTVGIIKTPAVISAGTLEYKYTSGSSGQLEVVTEAGGVASGRRAWRQLR